MRELSNAPNISNISAMPDIADLSRRFAGVGRLYGSEGLARLRAAHVCVVGIGGVGSWAAEALARSAVGRLTLVDLDMVAESNVNRQVHALDDAFGKAKTGAMAERILAINPSCRVDEVEDFVSPENVAQLLDRGFHYVIDAIDQVRAKAAMIAWCKASGVAVITAGGAGGQVDPTRIEVTDLALTIQDPLLARVRALLRKEYGFPREAKKKFGVRAVFSREPVRHPVACGAGDSGEGSEGGGGSGLAGLSCAGYGSSVCVTAPFGLFAAGEVLRRIAAGY